MPKKRDLDQTHAQKVIKLFAKLIFSDRRYSLSEISESLNCSKQTVQRLVDHINSAYSVIIDEEIENRQKYYHIKRIPGKLPVLGLTDMEYRTLQMCKTFTEHLIGKDLFDEATHALEKSSALLESSRSSRHHFATLRPGHIDYTCHQQVIRTVIQAMDARKICKIVYQSPQQDAAKTFHIMPLKLFSHQGALYLHARMATPPGEKRKRRTFDPLLAVHRILKSDMTGYSYEFPQDYDFEKRFNREFGIIKADPFEVEVIFTGFAAIYVSERIWDEDQVIERLDDDAVKLTFTAASIPEVTSWILSFDREAEVVAPEFLRERIKELIEGMREIYE